MFKPLWVESRGGKTGKYKKVMHWDAGEVGIGTDS